MTTGTEVSPLVLIVSGPSGSGKSTLVQRLLELPRTMPSVSRTTRPRRTTESSGKCYDFVTEAEFDTMAARGEFLEYARVFGKYAYGTPRKWLDESRRTGRDLVLEIDVQGAAQVKEKLPESVAIFILPPSREELERRLAAAARIPKRKLRGVWLGLEMRFRPSASIMTIALSMTTWSGLGGMFKQFSWRCAAQVRATAASWSGL